MLNEANFNKLLVMDVTLGVPNQTIYCSIADFAKAINTPPSYISTFLSTRKKLLTKNISEPRFYQGKYFIVELRKDTIPSPLPLVIEVTDLEKTTTKAYPTASVVAKVLGITRTKVVHYLQLKDPKPLLGIYSLKKVNSHLLEPNQNQSTRGLINGRVNKLENYRKNSSIGLEIINIQTSETIYFPSLTEAAIKLGCNFTSLYRYLNRNTTKPFKGKFIINRQDSGNEVPLSSVTEINKVLKYEVTNLETSVIKGYPSLASISREIGINSSYLSKYLKKNSTKPIKGKYIIKNKEDSINNKEKVSSVLPLYKNTLNKFPVNYTEYDQSLFNPLDFIPKIFNILKTRFLYAVAVGSSIFILYLPVFYYKHLNSFIVWSFFLFNLINWSVFSVHYSVEMNDGLTYYDFEPVGFSKLYLIWQELYCAQRLVLETNLIESVSPKPQNRLEYYEQKLCDWILFKNSIHVPSYFQSSTLSIVQDFNLNHCFVQPKVIETNEINSNADLISFSSNKDRSIKMFNVAPGYKNVSELYAKVIWLEGQIKSFSHSYTELEERFEDATVESGVQTMELSTKLKRTEFMLQNAKAIITNSENTLTNIKRNVENDENLVSSLQPPINNSNIGVNDLEEELIKIVNELEIANNTIDGNTSLIGELNEEIDGLNSKIYTLEDKLEEEKAKAQEYLVWYDDTKEQLDQIKAKYNTIKENNKK